MQAMQNLTLYTVATPIGNLQDITLRAIEILKTVDIIICEDTRETQKLLQEYGISGKQLLSYHAQSGAGAEERVLGALAKTENGTAALVSDRGTPGISDPGVRLIHMAVASGVKVVPIPGVSAVVTALQASGVDTSQFLYLGFLPHKKGRQTMLTFAVESEQTVVFYESPHRLLKALAFLKDFGRHVIVARELTKMHEEFVRGTAAEVYETFLQRGEVLGECVVIVYTPFKERRSEEE
jgi:16S rRNA (cytidine1402-2'-O)-methyltransferase